jgi:hypothetical protein
MHPIYEVVEVVQTFFLTNETIFNRNRK